MNGVGRTVVALVLLAAAAGGGYWMGQRGRAGTGAAHVAASASSTDSAPSADGAGSADAAGSTGAAAAKGKPRKIRFYRNPMGLPDTSPVPKKDPMGMDYIPVYEGGDEAADEPGTITISTAKVQKLGVRTEPAALRTLDRVVRAAGRVEIDERRVFAVAPKFEGWVERLHVNATGQPVSRGQPLFEVYSPELVSAQREYAIAVQGAAALKEAAPETREGMRQLAESSLARLRNWDISGEQIDALTRSGDARRTLTLRSPVSGIVTEKKALQGMRFMAGESLYQIADLSSVWVIADVFEQDIGAVRRGARARVKVSAYPGKRFEGAITYVYPTMNAQTRTVPVRLELSNPGTLLKPAMFAEVELPVSSARRAITVPTSAVIDSGTRQIVLVQAAEGRFTPREVKLGERSDTHVEVVSGVADGERVVVSANFLIDAESNLRAAISGFGTAPAGGGAPAPAATGAGAGAATGAGTAVGHQGTGTLESIDAKAGTVELRHEPIPSLKWPAMTMEFTLANPSLVGAMKPGQPVNFEIVERKPGEWVITRLTAKSQAAGAHSGH